jgi:LPS-assembly protein
VPFEPHPAAPQHRLRPVSAVVRAAFVLAAGSAALGQAGAQTGTEESGLQLQPSLQLGERLQASTEMAGPTFLLGDHVEGQTDVRTRIEGHAELRRHEMVLKAERIEHRAADDTVNASGGVRINRLGNLYEGPELQLRLDSNVGYFLQPRFTLIKGGQGEASRLDFLGEKRASADNAVYSTCPRPGSGPWHPDWWISARKMEFDSETDTGTAHGGVLHFKGLPILGSPYVEFPLSDARRSGLLPPSINIASQSGLELALPYYLNLSPQRDATITPTLMSQRGLNVGGEFRYLESDYSGELRGAYMPADSLRDADRWSLSFQHRQNLSAWPGIDGMGLRLNLNQVSDANYWRDFPHTGKLMTQRLLPSEAALSWGSGDWSFSAGHYSWQTLQDPLPATQIIAPYDRIPSLAARLQPAPFSLLGSPGWEGSLQTEFTRFATDRQIKIGNGSSAGEATVIGGDRALLVAKLSRSWQAPGWFIKPGVQLHARQYQFDQALEDGQSSLGLALPTLSLDSGLQFERETRLLGRDLVQTLEPRLYYSRTPWRKQNHLPSYDSAPFDFSLSTVFQPNPYAGNDRIADLDALTLGATSRLLQAETGAELMSLGVAQRYRFREQRVTLPGESSVAAGLTDLLLGARVNWTPQWSSSVELQYNPESGESTRSTLGLRYLPGPYRVLNAAYRVKRQSVTEDSRQLDLGWQWPLQGLSGDAPAGVAGRGLGPQQWYSVGRINYSLPESRIVDLLAGFEYDAGCWIARVAFERLQNSTTSANQRIMFQLEFSDFTRIGSSPLQSLHNHVPRYQLLREEINPPSRFERYE